MKILHLRSSGGLYGAEGVILALATELADRKIENRVLCLRNLKNPHVELIDEARKRGLDAFFVDCNGLLDHKTISSLRRQIIDDGFDIIHCHDYKSDIYGLLASAGLKVKRITTNHLWTGDTLSLRVYEFVDGMISNFFDRVIAVSPRIQDEASRFCFNKKKVSLIPNGIHTDQFQPVSIDRPGLCSTFGVAANDVLIGMIGRLTPQKGHRYMFDAMKDIPKAKLLIFGDGALREELTALTAQLGLNERIIFCGTARDMVNIYNLIDIFVMPSLDEGLPLALLEAMACGRPVIASKVGAIPAVVTHLTNGLLIEPKDTKALAEMVNRLISDPDLRQLIAGKARETVVRDFSSVAMANKYGEIYSKLLVNGS